MNHKNTSKHNTLGDEILGDAQRIGQLINDYSLKDFVDKGLFPGLPNLDAS